MKKQYYVHDRRTDNKPPYTFTGTLEDCQRYISENKSPFLSPRQLPSEHPQEQVQEQSKKEVAVEGETTDKKVELALKQNNKMYNDNEKEIFRCGYIYGMVRANEEGCVWGLQQGKAENERLLSSNKELKNALRDLWEDARGHYEAAEENGVDNPIFLKAKALIEANSIK